MKIRLFGLLLLCVSAVAFYALSLLVALPAADRSGLFEFAIGFLCVAAEMLGLPMLALGAGLFAPTELPPRSWYPVRGVRRPAMPGRDAPARVVPTMGEIAGSSSLPASLRQCGTAEAGMSEPGTPVKEGRP